MNTRALLRSLAGLTAYTLLLAAIYAAIGLAGSLIERI